MSDNDDGEANGTPDPPAVLVVGECLVDLAPVGPAPIGRESTGLGPRSAPTSLGRHFVAMPGGSPANVAVGLARLGVGTAFAGRFSRSGFGPWLRDHLSANGVDVSLSVDATQPATLAVVTFDQRGQASYTFYGPETADWQWADDELPPAHGDGHAPRNGPRFAAVHTGSLITAFQPGAHVLAHWLTALHNAGDVLVSFDPNVRPGLVDDASAYRRLVEDLVASSHIVKASGDDIDALYPGTNPLDVAERWLSTGAALVLVTEGERGASAFHQSGRRARSVPPKVVVQDTIGAGDAFSSGLLAYLAEHGLLTPAGAAGMDEGHLRAALDQAVTVSAITCTREGADPPDRHELAAFMAARDARSAAQAGP